MAVEFSGQVVSVFGNKRAVFGRVDMSGVASGSVDTGLRRIDFASVCPASYTTAATSVFKFAKNTGSGATAINGYLYIGGATAADQFEVLCIGD